MVGLGEYISACACIRLVVRLQQGIDKTLVIVCEREKQKHSFLCGKKGELLFLRYLFCFLDMDTDSGSKDIAREGLSAAYKEKETRSASYLQDFFNSRGSFTSQFRPTLLTLNTYYKEKEISHSSSKSKFLDIDVFC